MAYKLHPRSGLYVSKSGKVKGHLEMRIHNTYIEVVYPGPISLKTGRHLRRRIYLHRLVMETYVGESRLHVNHKDGDKFNNHLSNLEYVTLNENVIHAHEHGLNDVVGINNGRARLSERDVLRIRRLGHKAECLHRSLIRAEKQKIADEYGLHYNYVNLILSRTVWAHL